MRLGFSIPNNQGVAQVEDLVKLACDAETLGYHSVWVSEHLFHSEYVAKRLHDRPYHDPLTILTAAACATQDVRLGTSVLVLPWHHPVRLGKTIATLDQLSGGRVDLGVGVGVTADEYANLGIDFASRGRRADEILAALLVLWSQDLPAFDGEFYQFADQRFAPKPLQAPLPIHIGGGAPPALRRVAAHGQGWHALGKSPQELQQSLAQVHALMSAAGRDPSELYVSIRCVVSFVDEPWDQPAEARRTLKGTEQEVAAVLQAYAEAGVHEVIVDANTDDVGLTREVMAKTMKLLG